MQLCVCRIAVLLLLAASSYFTTRSDEEGSEIRDIACISNETRQEEIFINRLRNQLYNRLYNNSEKYCDIEAACGGVKCSYIPEEFNPGEVIRIFVENTFKVYRYNYNIIV